jgi:protein-tyrosine kinase
MDMKVSLENAEKSGRAAGESTLNSSSEPTPETHDRIWSTPVYHNCRSVDLDPDKLRKNRCVCFFPEASTLNYYKILRTQIVQRCKVNHWNTIMITSAVPGEGKTTTAINLAATFAKSHGQTTMLVDCDLQRQSVHQYLGISSPKGLGDYLQNGTSLKDLIVWPGVEKLTIISGGDAPVPDSAELISSPRMAELVAEMKARYADRYIFYDLPPLLAGPDALAFAPLADGILMVVRPETSMEDAARSLALIPKEKFLGFVLNGIKPPPGNNYHRYPHRSKAGV